MTWTSFCFSLPIHAVLGSSAFETITPSFIPYDNNCLARVCFSPIKKNENEVLDIQWDITLLSYGETKYPDKLEIENGSKVVIPLKYTNKYYKTLDIGLKRYNDGVTDHIGIDSKKDLFRIENKNISRRLDSKNKLYGKLYKGIYEFKEEIW